MSILPTTPPVSLPYISQGDPDAIPLILLHGLTDSHRSYEPVLAELPDTIRAYAVTLRGHGDAPKPDAGYTAADFAGDVAAFMDEHGIDRAIVAGHSLGSWVARSVAARYPERLLGLVLAGCFHEPDFTELIAEFAGVPDPMSPEYARAWQESTLARPIPEPFMQVIIEETLKTPPRVGPAALGAMMDDVDGPITVPTRLYWGERDAMVPRSDQDALLAAIPGAELTVYEGGGHALHWERPARYAADLVAFAATV